MLPIPLAARSWLAAVCRPARLAGRLDDPADELARARLAPHVWLVPRLLKGLHEPMPPAMPVSPERRGADDVLCELELAPPLGDPLVAVLVHLVQRDVHVSRLRRHPPPARPDPVFVAVPLEGGRTRRLERSLHHHGVPGRGCRPQTLLRRVARWAKGVPPVLDQVAPRYDALQISGREVASVRVDAVGGLQLQLDGEVGLRLLQRLAREDLHLPAARERLLPLLHLEADRKLRHLGRQELLPLLARRLALLRKPLAQRLPRLVAQRARLPLLLLLRLLLAL
mmetsp:Transcript_3684/g.11480  ORF Transcript_3684/g.11480 Transcript_3684/m.11480 type:complete len:282 (-) Transcript_3684:27-872(-)